MTNIHPSAVVDPKAKIDASVHIGAFCVVGPDVTLGKNVRLVNHVCVDGITTIGEGTTVFPFASLGQPPQSLAYKGEHVELIIGKNNIIREHVTMSRDRDGNVILETADSLRPLLGWRRRELEAVVTAAGVGAADDPSNADDLT
jgi:UDP-N-acetylglucosamine acyltransferase